MSYNQWGGLLIIAIKVLVAGDGSMIFHFAAT